MKTLKYVLSIAVTLTAIACVQEENPVTDNSNVELVPMTFTVTADTEADTKVFYDGEATKWEKDDKIMVISANGIATEFTATEVNGATATFEGKTEQSDKFYAVYPVNAYRGNDLASPTNTDIGGRLYVNVPEIQTAVAGTFDKNAFVSIAESDGDNLNFKNLCSVVKFALDNPEGVKSVRFTMTSNTNLAGTGNIYIKSLTSHTWGDDIKIDGQSIRYSKNMITLNAPAEGFQANTDYYFVQRVYQQSSDNKDGDGVQFYIEYENKISVIEGTSAFDASRNSIIPLGTIDTNTKLRNVTPYEAYNLGFDIMVARKPINIKNNGAATLISTADQTIQSNGVYFINSDVSVTLKPASGHYTSLYVLGNNPQVKSQMQVAGNVRWAANGNIVLKGVEILDDPNNQMFQSNGDNGTLLFDSCVISSLSKSQLVFAGHPMAKFGMYNCDFKVSANNKYIISINKAIAESEFVNNIIYSTGKAYQFKFMVGNPTITDLLIANNTVANVFPYTYAKAAEDYSKIGGITNFKFNNNLFYIPDYSDDVKTSVVNATPTNTEHANNYLYKTTSTTSKIEIVTNSDLWVSTTSTSADVVTSVDLANGVIVPATTAGATR